MKKYFIIMAIIAAVFLVNIVFRDHQDPVLNAGEKYAVCISKIKNNKNEEELVKKISEITGSKTADIKKAVDYYNYRNQGKWKEEQDPAGGNKEYADRPVEPAIAAYPEYREAKAIKDKLDRAGMTASVVASGKLDHDEKFNVDYAML